MFNNYQENTFSVLINYESDGIHICEIPGSLWPIQPKITANDCKKSQLDDVLVPSVYPVA